MASAAKTAPKKKAPKPNGNSKADPPTSPPSKSAVSSIGGTSSLGISLLTALAAFAFGVLTPPVWHEFREMNIAGGVAQRRAAATQDGRQNYPCSQERLEEFWHERPVRGFHIVCFGTDDEENLSVIYYKNARRIDEPDVHTLGSHPVAWPTLRAHLAQHLGLTATDDLHQPWAMFTPQGERAVDEVAKEQEEGLFARTLAEKVGMLLVYQGGQFLWPGVRIGFKREIPLYSIIPGRDPIDKGNWTVVLETLSLTPLVISVQGFLSEDECIHIREVAEPSMQYSGVVLHDADEGRPASDFRTSKTTFLSAVDDTLLDIDYRTASLTRIPRRHQESVQVLRYGQTEYYTAHHDFFDPALYQKDPNTLRLIGHGRRNRLATVFWYLSDVEEGGHTVFPRFNGGREKNFNDCETGLLVKPEMGKVIIFYSLNFDGSRDQNSLHGACPVKDGIKWAANKWIWNEEMAYTPE